MAQVINTTPYLARVGLYPRLIDLMSDTTDLLAPKMTNLVVSSKQDYEKIGTFAPFGLARPRAELTRGTSDVLMQPHTRDFRPVMNALTFVISMQADYTDVYKKLAEAPNLLSRSLKLTREFWFASLFNLGNTASGSSGAPCVESTTVAQFATTHVLDSGATDSNYGTSALANSALETAIQTIGRQKEYRSVWPFKYGGKFWLMVAPEKRFLAERIVGATNIAGSTDNDPNKVGPWCEVVTNPFISSARSSSWWVLPKNHNCSAVLERIPLFVKSWEDNHILGTMVTTGEEYLYLWTDYRGTYGSYA